MSVTFEIEKFWYYNILFECHQKSKVSVYFVIIVQSLRAIFYLKEYVLESVLWIKHKLCKMWKDKTNHKIDFKRFLHSKYNSTISIENVINLKPNGFLDPRSSPIRDSQIVEYYKFIQNDKKTYK